MFVQTNRFSWIITVVVCATLGARTARCDELHFAADRPADIQHIKLNLSVDLEHEHIDATATLTISPLRAVRSIKLDAVGLDVSSVSGELDGATRDLRYANDGRNLEVYFDKPLAIGSELVLRIKYAVDHPADGLHFFAPSDGNPDAPYQVWSQGESIANRYWIPCFDHTNEMQTTEIIATVDSKYEVLSNGRLLSKKADPSTGKTTFHWLQDQPHVAYLITLVVGEFAVERDEWRGKPLLYYVPKDRVDEVATTFGNTKRMLDFFSDHIGVEYAWDKYAQVTCYQYGGGMENTSATTMGENMLHDARSRIDGDSEGLISHEMAHQWFGDLLTCNEWTHIWLNEGFASYFEALWEEESKGPENFAYNMYQKASSARSGGKEHPIVYRGYSSPDQQFDSRAYPKGAWVLHMLRRRVGDATFWKIINQYVSQHRHQTVETSDFREVIEAVTGTSFERFFYDWTERPGHPVVKVSLKWNNDERMAEVRVEQTQKADAFHLPLEIELRDADGSQTAVRRNVTEKSSTFLIPLASRPALMRVDPRQAVLMELTVDQGRDLWLTQLSDDPSPVARLQAIEHLEKKKNDVTRAALADALKNDGFWAVRQDAADALGKVGGDAARDALLAGLGSDDPRVRRSCASALGKFKDKPTVAAALAKLLDKGDESFRVESAAAAAYVKLGADNAVERVRGFVERDKKGRYTAILRALGERGDAASVDLLLGAAKPGGAMRVRGSALSALGAAAAKAGDDDALRGKILAALSSALRSKSNRDRGAAARALRAMGGSASEKLGELRELAASETDTRVRDALKGAIKRIEEDQPNRKQVADLGKRLDTLMAENKTLRERIETLEARERSRGDVRHASGDARGAPVSGNGANKK